MSLFLDADGRIRQTLEPGSMFRRLCARLLDALVAGAMSFAATRWLEWGALLGTTWFVLADGLWSPGKALFRLRVVGIEGTPCTLRQAVLRNWMLGLPTFGRIVLMNGWWGADLSATRWDRGALGCVGVVVICTELFTMLVQPLNRRWGDHLAGTRVVEN